MPRNVQKSKIMTREEKQNYLSLVTSEIADSVEMGFYEIDDLERPNYEELKDWVNFQSADENDIAWFEEMVDHVAYVIKMYKFNM